MHKVILHVPLPDGDCMEYDWTGMPVPRKGETFWYFPDANEEGESGVIGNITYSTGDLSDGVLWIGLTLDQAEPD